MGSPLFDDCLMIVLLIRLGFPPGSLCAEGFPGKVQIVYVIMIYFIDRIMINFVVRIMIILLIG